ncbi:probable RNA-directed DNA polymerase from transposon X-element [Trichonephila clavipes]|nr:probable RNA-directed DNA polymerase from transposon X-element [Trichonephila clavipes]
MDGALIIGCTTPLILFLIIRWFICHRRRKPQLRSSLVIAGCLQPQVVCRSVPCRHPYYRVISDYSAEKAPQKNVLSIEKEPTYKVRMVNSRGTSTYAASNSKKAPHLCSMEWSNKAFLFGDFNVKHPSWNPGRANTNGNILCNWAVASALDILAPDTPTHFNTYHTNAILDIGFAVNLSHTEVFTINALSSDHNPVIFDFVTNNVLPPILRTLKSTNWTKFQEIIYHNIPGNPQIDDLDLAVQNFTSNISNAISASTFTRLINTPHLRLPENIRELIRAKNRFRKLWNNTRYPPYKREVNALIRQIRSEIQEHKNRTWKDFC